MPLAMTLLGCENTNNSTTIESESESVFVEEELSGEVVELDVLNTETLRFSSVADVYQENGTNTYKMEVPYDDNYQIYCDQASTVELFNYQRILLKETKSSMVVNLKKGQIVYIRVNSNLSSKFELNVIPIYNMAEMPYQVNSKINTKTLSTTGNNNVDPLQACKLEYTKRDDGKGLYVNCNNPEKLSKAELNTSLIKQDVTDKEVFFTFEHNNIDDVSFYYGYRVTNTDDHDIYITVKNVGFQVAGAGSWLGEKEWVDFYNVNFRYDGSKWSDKQKQTFVDYYNFCNTYKAPKNQPITYRIPKGKYIYVMGGTTKDAYKHINVWKTADKKVCGGCSNGVVLFDVIGQAEGTFFVYTNEEQIKDNRTHQGYIVERDGHKFGSQYVGYDHCHGVVDTHFTATFNDNTPSQDIPVEYTNHYATEMPENKKPYMALVNEDHHQVRRYWATHISAQSAHDGVGTDMTKYITVNQEGRDICIDADHLDGHGNVSNIGNWMIDYIDCFTLVNQGDNDREVTINMRNTGSLCVFLRDKKGKVIKSSPMFTMMTKSDKGEEYNLENDFTYTVKVKAHSIKQFVLEYNLLANSCGYVVHKVTLK